MRSESGQSLLLIVLAMSLIVGLAAFAIDAAQWKVGRHQAQIAADAAALAAANCLATQACSSTSSGGDAYTKATSYATTNGVPASSVTIAGGQVTVITQTPAPEVFAGMLGVHPNVSAHAVATYTKTVQAPSSVYGADCANPTNPPTSNCGVNCTSPGVTITANGSTNITGAIETNGYVNINIGGGATLGPVESGPGVGTTCGQNTATTSGSATIANGPADATSFTSFPTTYSNVWTSATSNECSASSTYTGSGYPGHGNITVSGGTSTVPSTITISGNNTTIGSSTSAPVVMCASTSISIPGNSATLTDVTLVAPSISIGGNGFTITPASTALPDTGTTPLVALYDTSATTLNFGSNNPTINGGAVYAPMAAINVSGNNGTSALFEGNTVTITGNNGGDGPTTTLTAFPGSDQLTQ